MSLSQRLEEAGLEIEALVLIDASDHLWYYPNANNSSTARDTRVCLADCRVSNLDLHTPLSEVDAELVPLGPVLPPAQVGLDADDQADRISTADREMITTEFPSRPLPPLQIIGATFKDTNGKFCYRPNKNYFRTDISTFVREAIIREPPSHPSLAGDDNDRNDKTKGPSKPTETEPTRESDRQREIRPLETSGRPTGPCEPTETKPTPESEGQWETPLPETSRRPTRRWEPTESTTSQPTGLWEPPAEEPTPPSSGLWKSSKGCPP